MNPWQQFSCREVSASGDIAALTKKIRSAFAPHAAGGLRCWATHQSETDTLERVAAGYGFVGEFNGEVVATITLRASEAESRGELLREPHTWSFGQFAGAPEHKGKGFGRRIHDFASLHAAGHGAKKMALHTAQPATALIAMHRSWGYRSVGTCVWRPHTRLLSVLMEKSLSAS